MKLKKLLYLAIAILILISEYSVAQWVQVYSGTIGNTFESAYFSSSTNGLLSSSSSVIATSNSGTNWAPISSVFGIRDISFVNATTGFAAGIVGNSIYKTVNGGTTWTLLTPVTSNSLWGVSAPSVSVVYVCGTGGVVWKTINGGTTFTAAAYPSSNLMVDIEFVSTTEGYVLDQVAGVFKTVNGGTSWTTSYASTGSVYSSIFFLNATTGFACGNNGRIIRTTNGGSSWTILTTNSTAALNYIHFFDSNNGMAVGLAGKVLRTTNGGNTWFTDNIPTTNHLYCCALLSPTEAIVGCDSGYVYRNSSLGTGIIENKVPVVELTAYPNPGKDFVTFLTSSLQSFIKPEVKIYDVRGNLIAVRDGFNNGKSITISTSDLKTGIYLVELFDNHQVIASSKILITD